MACPRTNNTALLPVHSALFLPPSQPLSSSSALGGLQPSVLVEHYVRRWHQVMKALAFGIVAVAGGGVIGVVVVLLFEFLCTQDTKKGSKTIYPKDK